MVEVSGLKVSARSVSISRPIVRRCQRKPIALIAFGLASLAFAGIPLSWAADDHNACEAWNRSIMENVDGQKRKVIAAENAAVSFLQALTERIWLSLYFGRPTAALNTSSGNPFCGELPFVMFGHDGTETQVSSVAEIPMTGDQLAFGYWPYSCSPTNVTFVRSAGDSESSFHISIIHAASMNRLFDVALESIRQKALTRSYCLPLTEAREELLQLDNIFKRRDEKRHPDSNVYGGLHGYYILDHPDEASSRARSVDFLVNAGFGVKGPVLNLSGRIMTARFPVRAVSNTSSGN